MERGKKHPEAERENNENPSEMGKKHPKAERDINSDNSDDSDTPTEHQKPSTSSKVHMPHLLTRNCDRKHREQ